jgi:hypothetical protein
MAADVLHFGLPPVRFPLVLGRPCNSSLLDLVFIQRMGDDDGLDLAPGFPAQLSHLDASRVRLSVGIEQRLRSAQCGCAKNPGSGTDITLLCENWHWDGLRTFRPQGHPGGPGRLRYWLVRLSRVDCRVITPRAGTTQVYLLL